VLAAGKQLLHLRLLSLASCRRHGVQDHCLDSKDINSIVDSCPVLQSLRLSHVVCPSADVHSLSQLGATLDTLNVAGAAFKGSAARAVAQLTNLQTLEWRNGPLGDAGLRQFTALTALTKLQLSNCKLSQELEDMPSMCGRVCPGRGEQFGMTTEIMEHRIAVSVT
jgi:hypothetical protein